MTVPAPPGSRPPSQAPVGIGRGGPAGTRGNGCPDRAGRPADGLDGGTDTGPCTGGPWGPRAAAGGRSSPAGTGSAPEAPRGASGGGVVRHDDRLKQALLVLGWPAEATRRTARRTSARSWPRTRWTPTSRSTASASSPSRVTPTGSSTPRRRRWRAGAERPAACPSPQRRPRKARCSAVSGIVDSSTLPRSRKSPRPASQSSRILLGQTVLAATSSRVIHAVWSSVRRSSSV